jgi:hypothetical protein
VAVVILKLLTQLGGSAHRSAVYGPAAETLALSSDQLAKLTPGGKSAWRVRVNFSRLYLANSGLLRSTGKGVWSITPAGTAAVDSGDVLAAVREAYKAYKEEKAVGAAPTGPHKGEASGRDHAKLMASSARTLATLIQLAGSSTDPEAFESAVTRAFLALGLNATHIGGSGDTDVLVAAHHANPPYSVVVDTKTTKHLKVGDSQIHWHHIAQHRKDRGADYAVVVAIGFHGGLVTQKALEDHVALIAASDLQSVLEWHEQVRFSQEDLRALFTPDSGAGPNLQKLTLVASQRSRRASLLRATIQAAAEYSEGAEEAIGYEAVHAYLKAKLRDYGLEVAPSPDDVREAMTFLANPYVGVLAASGVGFTMQMSPETAVARLTLIGQSDAGPQLSR